MSSFKYLVRSEAQWFLHSSVFSRDCASLDVTRVARSHLNNISPISWTKDMIHQTGMENQQTYPHRTF